MEKNPSPQVKPPNKKSKLPIILIGLGCIVLLCGTVTVGGIYLGYKALKDKANECVAEGVTIGVFEKDKKCCEGLTLIDPRYETDQTYGICTAKCGDGTCDSKTETEYNCSKDCKIETECYKEGETIPVVPDANDCCEGLELIDPMEKVDGIAGICTAKCGNGICNPQTENDFNCPQDCEKEEACIPEGLPIPVIPNAPDCCSGLTLIPPMEKDMLGISGFCTAKCGDGDCDDLIESNYNCPADCNSR